MASYLHVGAINITTSPPSTTDEYTTLVSEAFLTPRTTRLQGDWVGMIGSCKLDRIGSEPVLRGEFYKYIDLQITRDWFNLLEGKKARPSDLEAISIPDHLKPHFQFLQYVFIPNGHRLFFVTKDRKDTLSPIQAKKIVEGSLADHQIRGRETTVDVVIEQSQDKLDAILSMDRIQALTIEVIPPNAFSDAEKKLLQDMTGERVTKKTVTVISDTPQGLDPSPGTKILAKLALSLGKVIGRGNATGGKLKTVSTSDHPYIEQIEFFPNLEAPTEKLFSIATTMLNKIKNRANN